MINNYFKIAWRNILKNKGYNFINILGLSLGLTFTILISLWIFDEISFDNFHEHKKETFKLFANRTFNNQTFTDQNMVLPLAAELEKSSSLIENAVVMTHPQEVVLNFEDKKIKKSGLTVSEHFFDVFTWKPLKGNPKLIFQTPNSVVLTKSTAEAIFGTDNPIDKIVRIPGNNVDVKILAVVEDVPLNSSISYDYILPFNYGDDDLKRFITNWYSSSWEVYVQTKEGANISQIEKQINDLKYRNAPDDEAISKYFIFPLEKLHLYNEFKEGKNVGGKIVYVWLFGIIALFILFIACINFMNLSTARSEKRSKEVGIRKTIGSNREQLIYQFFTESMLIVFISFVFSIFLVLLLLTPFNQLVGKSVQLDFLNPYFWISALIIIVFTGIIAGSYPALYLSSFNPMKVLKGTFKSNTTFSRKTLVVSQFAVSFILISATYIVYMQISHIQDRNLGYSEDKMIMIPTTEDIQNNFVALKNELVNTGVVENINRSFSPITEIWWKSPVPDWTGKPENSNFLVNMMAVDLDFTKTFKIKMKAGSDFQGLPSDTSAVILNETAVNILGLKDPIGTIFREGKQERKVIGVMSDLIMDSPFKSIDPLFVYFNDENSNIVNIRLEGAKPIDQSLRAIEDIFTKYNPDYPFEYKFIDTEYAKKYGDEKRIGKLSIIFSFLAIFISCLGLFGLASFVAEQRTKEIGIRKVLGASVVNLWQLLSKEFVLLVVISCVIAAPITWFFMNEWLGNYTYHTEISLWVFVFAGIGALLITILTVSFQAIRAALMNPVKSLRMD
ncbi:MAG TPA: ABC transporter permease [Saprospiraceae bacterium]|nr:ABC transporter permease [Saprospiraceae bacterium]HPN69066.1 ABC transporter permease [Saprospiraceae bacterium]